MCTAILADKQTKDNRNSKGLICLAVQCSAVQCIYIHYIDIFICNVVLPKNTHIYITSYYDRYRLLLLIVKLQSLVVNVDYSGF
jgi:hypothetical protein